MSSAGVPTCEVRLSYIVHDPITLPLNTKGAVFAPSTRKNQRIFIMKALFSFPNPVNEYAARSVAFMVLLLVIGILITGSTWLSALLLYGFVARLLTGPTLSPMGQIATRFVVPFVLKKEKRVPGPPKRFAQLIGTLFALGIFLSFAVFDLPLTAQILLVILLAFTFMESVLSFCAGCFVFQYLMKWGLIPQSICQQCVIK